MIFLFFLTKKKNSIANQTPNWARLWRDYLKNNKF